MKTGLQFLVVVAAFLLMGGCGGEKRPFEANFISKNDVVISYLGKSYQLNRFQRRDDLPFQYSFESDGDLDLVIDGREYEVDNPYDIDRKKKSTTPVKKKKTSYSKKSNKK